MLFTLCRFTPVGVHTEAEEALILQSIHDVPPGSTEKLVLVDVEIHFSSTTDWLACSSCYQSESDASA